MNQIPTITIIDDDSVCKMLSERMTMKVLKAEITR
jgi:hypothetical protein